MSRRPLAAGAALVLIATVSLTGCATISGLFGGAVRDDEGQISEGGQVDVLTLAVGDCLVGVEEGMQSSVDAVPCAEEHDLEAFHDFTLPAGDFPGEETVDQAAIEGCHTAFEEFIGLSYDESVLVYTYFYPSEESWTQADDRLITCLVGEESGPVTGTLAGAAR